MEYSENTLAVVAVIVLGIISVIITIGIMLSPALGGKKDDEVRFNNLMEEGRRKYPGSPQRSMVEFMRRERYQQIRMASNNHEPIEELSEDFVMLTNEIERLDELERMIGGDASVVINSPAM
jgi:hypothetical protein